MSSNPNRIVAVLHQWCSCGCCVPFGGNVPEDIPQNYADMARVRLESGLEIEICQIGIEPGQEVELVDGFYFIKNAE